MAVRENDSDRGATKQFLVACDGCSFERAATGREEAERIGDSHRGETGHDLVALEVPPSRRSA